MATAAASSSSSTGGITSSQNRCAFGMKKNSATQPLLTTPSLPIVQAEKTQNKAKLADRLITGLSGENQRWGDEIKRMGVQEGRLVGDILLASAFVSYAGPFNMPFREHLVSEKWISDLTERQVPMTKGVMPLDMLSNDSLKAKWGNEGLPTDPLSV